MIVFLYRWKMKPGKEKQFEDNWARVTKAIREQCGSYGSRLHLAGNGEYVGYAQWPDAKTRDACELDLPSLEALALMRDAVAHSSPDQQFTIRKDLLIFR